MENIFNFIKDFIEQIVGSITIENILNYFKAILEGKLENAILFAGIYIIIYLFLFFITVRLLGKLNRFLEIKRSFKNRFIRVIIRLINILPIIALNIGYIYLLHIITLPIVEYLYNVLKLIGKIVSKLPPILL